MATYYESIAGGDDTSRGGSLNKRHQNGGGAAVARARENASPRPTASHTPIVPAAPEPPVQESNSAAPTTAPHEGEHAMDLKVRRRILTCCIYQPPTVVCLTNAHRHRVPCPRTSSRESTEPSSSPSPTTMFLKRPSVCFLIK